MHCDMLKIQDGGAIVEKVNYVVTTAENAAGIISQHLSPSSFDFPSSFLEISASQASGA